ncbi:zinc finger protein 567 isoform X2 [Plutella xylostella]|uniref:zinc finger protein 567 isoform X2 n=1 Tax=Plutella xylostella TaxID=51655 RepID=UPI0020326244|nr:zinc finger protein 567 isoform X2 [Plutella xylostella]
MLPVLMFSMQMRRKRRFNYEQMYSSLCRTCLSSKDLHPIFYGKSSEKKRSDELLMITGLEIKLNDGMPQMICTTCLNFMNGALRFRRTAEKANTKLINAGFRKSVKKQREISSLPVNTNVKIRTIIIDDDKIKTDITENALLDDISNNHDYNFDNTYSDDFQKNDDHDNSYESPKCKSKKESKEPTVYACEVCNKEFKMKNTYKAHMRFHTNFCVCELCGKKCRNNNLLLLHKRGRHGMERVHRCAYCDYSAANKEALIIHERRHTGEKPYICDHCGASFHRRSNLVQHIAIHLPEKNFQCDMCSKRLKSRKFLQIHKHNAHTDRRYAHVCPLCARRYDKPNKVRAHLRTAHGLAEPPGRIVRIELSKCGY